MHTTSPGLLVSNSPRGASSGARIDGTSMVRFARTAVPGMLVAAIALSIVHGSQASDEATSRSTPSTTLASLRGTCRVLDTRDARPADALRPWPGATVVIEGPRDPRSKLPLPRRVVRAGETGEFVVSDLPAPGEYSVWMSHPDAYTSRTEFAADEAPEAGRVRTRWPADHARHAAATVSLDARGASLVLAAEPGVAITGVVRGADGAPVAGALVTCGGGGDHMVLDTRTDAEGRYRLGGFRLGSWTRMTVTAPGARYVHDEVRFAPAPTDRRLDPVSVPRDVSLERGGAIRGRWRQPSPSLRLVVVHESGFTADERSVRWSTDGSFVADTLEPGGRYHVCALATEDGLPRARSAWFLADVGGGVIELDPR